MKKVKKKATKVKRKVVKSKKKKVKKKKVKKAPKKKTKKKVAKKKARKSKKKVKKVSRRKKRKRRKKVSMEDLYSIIHKVQFGKKKIVFVTDLTEAPTIENTIRDVELKYNKVEMKTQAVFTLYPNDHKYEEEELLHLEIMDDEIPEIGQIFG